MVQQGISMVFESSMCMPWCFPTAWTSCSVGCIPSPKRGSRTREHHERSSSGGREEQHGEHKPVKERLAGGGGADTRKAAMPGQRWHRWALGMAHMWGSTSGGGGELLLMSQGSPSLQNPKKLLHRSLSTHS